MSLDHIETAAELRYQMRRRVDDMERTVAELTARAERAERERDKEHERAERLDRELTQAIEAGARIVGLQAGAMGYVTTNSEDQARFMSLAGLDEES